MQQRVVARRPWAGQGHSIGHRVIIAIGAVLLAGTVYLPANAAGRPASETDLPMLLLVQERPTAATPQLADLNLRIKTTLRESITASGRFQVHTFLPGDSVIKRALNEHLIAADDLAEPHKVAGLQRIAKAIGARFILEFGTSLDRVEARTEMKFLDNPNRADWLVRAEERLTVPLTIGRKRLRPDDIANMTVDSLTERMGIPTHLAANLQILPGARIVPGTDMVTKQGADKRSAKTTPKPPAADTPGAPDLPAPETRAAVKPPKDPVRQSGKVDKPTRGTAIQKPDPATPNPDRNRGAVDAGQGDGKGRPAFTNEADPARDMLPVQPSVAPPPVVQRPDYEAQAVRYRQTGDFGGAVVALRKAVNDRPRDIDLRRQLIQAYQSRQMPEAAHGEALRALRMDATNPSLYRLYGEVLMTEGDLNGSTLAFQDGIKVDPSDIGCQVALGDVLLASNHFLQALEAYSAASKSDPKSPLPHRRMARALAARTATDTDQYQASLSEVRTALDLTLPADTTSYLEDYTSIMRTVESRIREMLEQLEAANQARVQVKVTQPELLRRIADLNQRSDALAVYLDKLPPAAGHNVTQAHYVRANAIFSQALGFFKDLVQKGDDRFADSMKSGQVQSQRELANAAQRLTGTKANTKTRNP